MLRRALEVVVVTIGIFSTSWLLLRLSNGALWLPKEWRFVIALLVPPFGLVVYGVGKVAATNWSRWSRRHRGIAQGVGRTAVLRFVREAAPGSAALLAFVLAFVLLLQYQTLRETCIKTFQPHAGWWQSQFEDRLNESVASLDDVIPDFLDRRTSRFFVPHPLPPNLRADLSTFGAAVLKNEAASEEDRVSAGLQDRLDHAPMWLVDKFEEASAAPYLSRTKRRFFWLHVGIVGLVSAAAGLVFSRVETIAEAIGGGLAGIGTR